jgi:hypothetical protein
VYLIGAIQAILFLYIIKIQAYRFCTIAEPAFKKKMWPVPTPRQAAAFAVTWKPFRH